MDVSDWVRWYISWDTGTFTIFSCRLTWIKRAISKLRRYIRSNIGLDSQMTGCSVTARMWRLVETAVLATIGPFSITVYNKIHESVVTFMRRIETKYLVNMFVIHERCKFYDRVARMWIPWNILFVLFIYYTQG